MFEVTQWIGFAGTALVISAYVPQIHHLIVERCSGGISIKAYALWFAAGILMLVHAVAIAGPVLMVLQGYQIGAGALVIFLAGSTRTRSVRRTGMPWATPRCPAALRVDASLRV